MRAKFCYSAIVLFCASSSSVSPVPQGLQADLRCTTSTDDKILVDLGAKPDNGASPDNSGNDEFGDGLRKVIHDIRSRKIRDFNIVAGEITAYRAKFLGDRSKILPL